MNTQFTLRCRCGRMQGTATELTPKRGNHIVCYCSDCQAFVRFLGRDDALDAHGGTDIFQMTPAQLHISTGAEHLRCMRLSEKGMMRWFAGCCNTPIGNTMPAAGVPFVGLVLCFAEPADERARAQALGPPLRVHARGAYGGAPEGALPGVPVRLILRSLRLLARAWMRGQQRPSPFFDPKTGAPVVAPRVLSAAEREALRPAVQ